MFGDRGPTAPQDFGDVFEPTEAAEPILARPVRNALTEWLTEIFASDELKAVGVKPRMRAIFDGPPGVGKTTLAHHLAARIGLRMLAVRPDRLIEKYLGSTGRNIGALFDAVAPYKEGDSFVLFLDEFDAVAITRKEAERSAAEERNAWVNTLLQRIEQHDGFLIAATNHASSIDPAVWRRFHLHIHLELPGQFERERILARYLAPLGLPRADLKLLAESLETASPALIRELCESLKRQIVIGPKVKWDMRKEAVFDRLTTSLQPHPTAGKPRLWSHGGKDAAVRSMPWPLPRADEIKAEPEPSVPKSDNVAPFKARGKGTAS